MNKFLISFSIILSSLPVSAEPLSSAVRQAHEPGYFSVLLSLIFVICLIYATGIIYNKLNHLGLKTLKSQNKDFAKDKITILSTTPLGANRTLHVIELDGRKMLIGASANSIHLIKDLSASEPNENNVSENELSNSQNNEYMNEGFKTSYSDEEFGLYKKYLR